MDLPLIRQRLEEKKIFFSEDSIRDHPTVIGYDKRFRWRWIATQLNTFIVAIDFGAENPDVSQMERCLEDSFTYAKEHYQGWPRGLQSVMGAIVILLSSQLDEGLISYCRELNVGKTWAGFAVPVCVNSDSNEFHHFEKNPIWGRIYYPFFRELIRDLCSSPS